MIEMLPLNEETMDLEIDLCLRFHPSGIVPDGKNAERGRALKKRFLRRVFDKVSPAGFVAVRGGKPVGLLELMPRAYARVSGYITGRRGHDDHTLTIACLEVAVGENRKEVMEKLVNHLTGNLRVFRPYRQIEVGAFPGDVEFHPAWVYERRGFSVVEDRGAARLLAVLIPQK